MSFKILKAKVIGKDVFSYAAGDIVEICRINASHACYPHKGIKGGVSSAIIESFEILEQLYPTLPAGRSLEALNANLTAGQLLERHLDIMTKLLHEKGIK